MEATSLMDLLNSMVGGSAEDRLNAEEKRESIKIELETIERLFQGKDDDAVSVRAFTTHVTVMLDEMSTRPRSLMVHDALNELVNSIALAIEDLLNLGVARCMATGTADEICKWRVDQHRDLGNRAMARMQAESAMRAAKGSMN